MISVSGADKPKSITVQHLPAIRSLLLGEGRAGASITQSRFSHSRSIAARCFLGRVDHHVRASFWRATASPHQPLTISLPAPALFASCSIISPMGPRVTARSRPP
jgi:hypothetical protein